jgi:hypothetical protein
VNGGGGEAVDFLREEFTDGRKEAPGIEGATVFDDEGRRRAAAACGWAGEEAEADAGGAADPKGPAGGPIGAVRAVFVRASLEAVVPGLSGGGDVMALARMCVCGYRPGAGAWRDACGELVATIDGRIEGIRAGGEGGAGGRGEEEIRELK